MNVIVDTNIVFSALLKSDSKIAKILTDNKSKIKFISSNHLLLEIKNHKNKLLTITGLTNKEFNKILKIITSNIHFLDNDVIEKISFTKATLLVDDIDIDDVYFVAFAIQLNAFLWTGDKILSRGLKAKNFNKVITTQELYQYTYKKI